MLFYRSNFFSVLFSLKTVWFHHCKASMNCWYIFLPHNLFPAKSTTKWRRFTGLSVPHVSRDTKRFVSLRRRKNSGNRDFESAETLTSHYLCCDLQEGSSDQCGFTATAASSFVCLIGFFFCFCFLQLLCKTRCCKVRASSLFFCRAWKYLQIPANT